MVDIEFDLKRAAALRCAGQDGMLTCGHCDACIVSRELSTIKDWFLKCSETVKKFLLNSLLLVIRHEHELLEYVYQVLNIVCQKDFIYNQTHIAQMTDFLHTNQSWSNHAMSVTEMASSWTVSPNGASCYRRLNCAARHS